MTERRCKYRWCQIVIEGGAHQFCSPDHMTWHYLGTPILKLPKIRAEYEKQQKEEAKK